MSPCQRTDFWDRRNCSVSTRLIPARFATEVSACCSQSEHYLSPNTSASQSFQPKQRRTAGRHGTNSGNRACKAFQPQGRPKERSTTCLRVAQCIESDKSNTSPQMLQGKRTATSFSRPSKKRNLPEWTRRTVSLRAEKVTAP